MYNWTENFKGYLMKAQPKAKTAAEKQFDLDAARETARQVRRATAYNKKHGLSGE